jgi:flagellar protein FlgJ
MSLSPLPFNTFSPSDLTNQRLAADPTALADLKAKATQDPKGAVKAVASQFEALFLGTLMKQMRDTSFDEESENSSEMATYRSLLDEQLVQTMSKAGGVGLGNVLAQQISRIGNPEVDGTPQGASSTSLPASMMTAPRLTKALQAYQGQGKAVTAATAGVSETTGTQRGFIDSMMAHAQSAANKLGVAPELLVAHAALETGWGQKALRSADGQDSHNLFGIKAGGSWNGPTVKVLTTEYVGGAPQKQVETFRAYGSYQESFEDYARMLAENPRYRAALNQGGNAASFAGALQKGGYATDPGYARKLAGVAASVLSKRNDNNQSSLLVASR